MIKEDEKRILDEELRKAPHNNSKVPFGPEKVVTEISIEELMHGNKGL